MRVLFKFEVPSTSILIWHYTYLDKYTSLKMEGFNSVKHIEDKDV